MKPSNKRTVYTRVMNCSRCNSDTTHSLFDKENKLYKCNICGQTRIINSKSTKK